MDGAIEGSDGWVWWLGGGVVGVVLGWGGGWCGEGGGGGGGWWGVSEEGGCLRMRVGRMVRVRTHGILAKLGGDFVNAFVPRNALEIFALPRALA